MARDPLSNPRAVGFGKEGLLGVLREVTHGLANRRGKIFWSNNTAWLETLAVCFHRSLENILLILAPQLSQQQCVKAPWPMAGIQESPFYVPAKRNFLEKLQKVCYYHISLCGVKE